ncbi:23S rRNA (adenine(2030)-N(6))-methyltransferase RlmJ [soil metagenome]
MNYRHAYHAGNHGDVLKHAVLARALAHLTRKDKPLVYVDAQAGTGLYGLESAEALKTLEWQSGLGTLYGVAGEALPLDADAEVVLAPWRNVVLAANPVRGRPLDVYPGSPGFAAHLLRGGDRLILNELHPADFAALSARYAGDRRARVTESDANIAVKAALPPAERRGLILIDPPYEQPGEHERAIQALCDGVKRFATGVFMLWFPVTGDGLSEQVIAALRDTGIAKMMLAVLHVRHPKPDGGLAGSGLAIVNPPWPLAEELGVLGPALRDRLAQDEGARWTLEASGL